VRAILIASALALPLFAASARADDPACAQFQNPLAYNACLARLGPSASAPRGLPESHETRTAKRGARVTGVPEARRTRGRMRMEFTVTPR
jgi:hypothetical protein